MGGGGRLLFGFSGVVSVCANATTDEESASMHASARAESFMGERKKGKTDRIDTYSFVFFGRLLWMKNDFR